MEPQEFDIVFPRGDTCPITFELTDKDGNELDLSSSEVYFTLKRDTNTEDYLLQKRLTAGEIIYENGKIKTELTHKDTANKNYGKYYYDFQLKSEKYVKTLILGQIELTKEVTWISNE